VTPLSVLRAPLWPLAIAYAETCAFPTGLPIAP
jgi:hypothetical protein